MTPMLLAFVKAVLLLGVIFLVAGGALGGLDIPTWGRLVVALILAIVIFLL